MRRWPSFARFVLNDTPNNLLDRSGGSVKDLPTRYRRWY